MALFKISKGNSADLGVKNGTNKTKEGYAYFTPDDGKFYIDIADANTVNLGVNRIALSSFKADLSQSFTVNLTERSSFWTLNIPGLKELKEGLILHISISTRPNDVYNVLNINGLGNKLIYYRHNEPLGDNIQVPANLTLIYKDNLSSFDQVFTNENNQNISYGQSGWVVDSAYSINKSDIYYGNLAGNAATATQLYHTPYRQDVFLRGDNIWTNKFIGSLNVTDNINANKIYVGSKETYGSTSQPIYWNQGVPAEITTLGVTYGGTGATSFTANSIIMSGSTTTSALTTRAITNNSTNTAIATSTNIPTMNTLYYGLVAVNGSSQSRATTIYVPTDKGKSGEFLKSNGNNTPSWASLPTASSTAAGIIKIGTGSDNAAAGNHTHTLSIATTTETNNNITLAQGTKYKLTAGGSTYIFTMPAASTVTLNGTSTTSASFYAPTGPASTAGLILKSNSSGVPQWATEYSYTLPVASSSALGGIKTGYSTNGKNYAVQLNEQKAYVNVPWTDTNTTNVKIDTTTNRYYLLGYANTSHTTGVDTLYCNSSVYVSFETNSDNQSSSSLLYANKVYNAVWNDYAEYRKTNSIQPGKVYQENDNGEMTETRYRLIPGCSIASDTFGSAMGKTFEAQTPMAVAGRVLAYTYQNRTLYHAGMAVCSAPNGTVDIMSREEIITYPDCIIGYVSEIPDYEEWGSGHVQVDGRIWIKVK